MRRVVQKGFTLVEILVIAPVVILAIGAFVTVIISMVGEVLVSRASNAITYDLQSALNRIEQDVKLSAGFLAQNSIPLDADNDQGYDDNDADFTNVGLESGPALIINAFATTGNPLSTSSSFVYLTDQPNACASSQVSNNVPMTYNIVYFIKDNTLWRRTIMPANYADGAGVSCATPWQQPSCTPATPDYTSDFCKADDIKLVEDIADNGFIVQYFSSEKATIPDSTAGSIDTLVDDRNTALQSTSTVGVSLTISKVVSGTTVERSASLRTSRLDTNASAIASPVVNNITITPSNVAATYDSPGQITVSWDPVGATSYTLQYDTSSSFSSPTTVNDISQRSHTVSSLSSPRYYFRVRAVNSAGTSDWSSTVNAWTTITNGLVAWWPMNGNANDASGNGFNGTANNVSNATGQNGQANNAYSFNGTNAYLTIPGTPLQNLASGVTLSIWANPSTSANYARFFDIGNGASTSNLILTRNGTTSTLYYDSCYGCGSSTIYIGSGIINSSWNHYAVTQVGTSYAIYRNGVLLGSGTVTAIANIARGSSYIARSNWGGDAYYAGTLDDARIYNRALSASEILTLYNAGAK